MTPEELDELIEELSKVDTAEAVERPPAAARMTVKSSD